METACRNNDLRNYPCRRCQAREDLFNGASKKFVGVQPGMMGIERIWTPRLARGTRGSKSGDFTTRMSDGTASMTNSAVLPMKKRLRPDLDTTPMATMA